MYKIIIGEMGMFLYHYFEKEKGPFITLSDLHDDEAIKIHNSLEINDNNFSKRNFDRKYILNRRIIENWLYGAFMKKDGKPERKNPHYMILGECNDPEKWFNKMDYIKIPLNEFNLDTVSFTYGDSFPTFFGAHCGRWVNVRNGDILKYNTNIRTYANSSLVLFDGEKLITIPGGNIGRIDTLVLIYKN